MLKMKTILISFTLTLFFSSSSFAQKVTYAFCDHGNDIPLKVLVVDKSESTSRLVVIDDSYQIVSDKSVSVKIDNNAYRTDSYSVNMKERGGLVYAEVDNQVFVKIENANWIKVNDPSGIKFGFSFINVHYNKTLKHIEK